MEIKSVGFRTVGRPKTHWIHTVMEAAWNEIKHLYPEELQEYDDLYNQKEIIKLFSINQTTSLREYRRNLNREIGLKVIQISEIVKRLGEKELWDS